MIQPKPYGCFSIGLLELREYLLKDFFRDGILAGELLEPLGVTLVKVICVVGKLIDT